MIVLMGNPNRSRFVPQEDVRLAHELICEGSRSMFGADVTGVQKLCDSHTGAEPQKYSKLTIFGSLPLSTK